MFSQGWSGVSNPFENPMNASIPNSVGIVTYVNEMLYAHKGDGPLQLAMYNDFSVPAGAYIALFGDRTGDQAAQVELTDIFKIEFKDMAAQIKKFKKFVLDIYDEDSDEYRIIWGKNLNRFYRGSYDSRIGALQGLATKMTEKTVPLGAAAVLAFRTNIITKHATQHVGMDQVGNDTNSVYSSRKVLIKKLNKVRGILLGIYGDDDDCEAKVKRFFPVNLLGNRFVPGHHQLLVPKASFRRVCIHLPKKGETYEALVTGGDVWVATADNSNNPVASGYLFKDGVKVIIDPEDIGDITKKFIMATNVSLTTTVDLIFNIIKAK